jgi:4-amino-4-deoxy-L-arabinose transferase-like glycosyltransferase
VARSRATIALSSFVQLLLVALGVLLTLAAMSADPPLPLPFPLALTGTLLGTLGLLALFGTFRRGPGPDVALVPGRRLLLPLLQLVAGSALLVTTLRAAVIGVLPFQVPLLAVLVPAVCIWLAFALGLMLERLGVWRHDRGGLALWRREGFWLVVLTAVIQLPLLGSFGLIDPWETHYGEVAREMLARRDWISLWWAQDGWFWSKPILNFWLQGLSFAAFGVEFRPDHMIENVAAGLQPQPEWAVRLPIVALALAGQYALYVGTRAYVGRRAAFLGQLVLLTAPYWFLLTRQSMADMPYVACVTGALGMLLLALATDKDARCQSYDLCLRFVKIRLSGVHLVLGAILLFALPQIVYLISRNVTIGWGTPPFGFRMSADSVWTGSFGNCGLPGNAACAEEQKMRGVLEQPAFAAALWALAALLLLLSNRKEQRLKRLYYLTAWLFTGLSFMAKGAPGLVIVLAVWVAFLLVTDRLGELVQGELMGLGLISAAMVAPWFVQEYVRHGSPFFERLFVHDMYKRAFDHVHDTNEASGDDTSFRYYIWQLGYGLFPWTGVAAAGTLRCIGALFARDPAPTTRSLAGLPDARAQLAQLTYFCVLWQLACFGMFSITGTKFHHYILPLVPAAAVLAGVLLDELWQYGAGERTEQVERSRSPLLGVIGVASAVMVGFAGRDLVANRQGDIEGQVRLLHLFTYNYERPWPDVLDFRWELVVFTALATLACLALIVPAWRRAAALALCSIAFVWGAWGSNVYLVRTSPHWGQRETISEYYKTRTGPEEPLVAYQLNWKGENFYTGNKLATFVSTGKKFSNWIEEQKKGGIAVMFFTTEHTRVNALKRELGQVEKFELLTNESDNNKFGLVRVVL